MPNDYFRFKQFTINQGRCAFKVGTDGVLLGAIADVSEVKSILDVGTGSGLIALMLAQRSGADICAIEPDHESFIQATENVKNSGWSDRIEVIETDLQKYSPVKRFDLIVTNPPYFRDSIRNTDIRKSVTRHNDTLPSSELLNCVSRLLDDNGTFQLIMPYAEGNVFIAEAAGHGFYCNSILKIRPLPSSEIRRLILNFSRHKQKLAEKFLTIGYGKRHDYTDEYKELTKEFYLKF
jgi:tRNA1Val (adenine37-N6)-methyltransferase